MRTALRAAALIAVPLIAVLAMPLSAQAHRQWIVPSSTVLSGDSPWVTVDAATSNTLFHPDHRPMRLTDLVITGPDGAPVAPANPSTGQFRSTFDVQLTKPGTYKIATGNAGLSARYKLNGETKMWRGAPENRAKEIPAAATEVKLTESSSRNETFVTSGAPNDVALKTSGKGLEMQPVTHPNDLFSGEAAQFKFLIDGKPASGVEVTVLPGASRYRADTGEIKIKTDAAGALSVTFPEAGMYWINASVRDDKGVTPGASRNFNYTAVVEVLRP